MKSVKLAALVALMAASPMTLSAPAQAAPEPPSTPVTATASSMLTALSQHLKLPPEQARTRWRRERQAATTDAQLKRQLGKAYQGSWLSDDGQLNVAISDPTKATVVRVAGAHPKSISPKGMPLRDAVKLLNASKRPAGFVSWYPDPAADSVVVKVRPGTEATARTWLTKRLGATPFTVRTITTEIPRPTAQYIRGGGSITVPDNPFFAVSEDNCSIGFTVEGGFVTAGHCGKAGNSVNSAGPWGDPMGTIKSSVYGPEGDFAFVETYSTWTLMAEVWKYDRDKTVHIDGSAEAPIGATVCRSGRTTHWHCGKVLFKDVGLTNSEGVRLEGLTETSACAESGDSGGPFLIDGKAVGLVSHGSGDCKDGGITSFQPINEVLTTLNLKLLTEDEEPPWSPDPGFGPCC